MIGHALDGEPIKTRGRRKRHLDSDETSLTNMSEEQTSDPEDSLRMVLIGKTGVGKSAVGNTILMEKLFPSSVYAASVTTACKRGTGKVQGRKLEVIDTPGLFDINLGQEKVTAEIAKWFAYAAPGPHVFLIILKADRFTKEEEETVKILQELFGEQAAHYTKALKKPINLPE